MLRFHRNYPDSKRPRNKAQLLCCNNVNNTALQLFRSTPSKVSHKVLVGYPLTAMRRQRPRPRTKADTQNSAIPACLALFSERHPLAELFAILLGGEWQEDGRGVTGWNFSWWPHWGKDWRVLALPACLPASRRRRRGGRAEDTTAGASWVRQHSPTVYRVCQGAAARDSKQPAPLCPSHRWCG